MKIFQKLKEPFHETFDKSHSVEKPKGDIPVEMWNTCREDPFGRFRHYLDVRWETWIVVPFSHIVVWRKKLVAVIVGHISKESYR